MPMYRFTQSAFYEIDIEAKTLEDAEKLAEENWYERFGRAADNYGGPKFWGIAEEEAECKLKKCLPKSEWQYVINLETIQEVN
ncbi:TPA: hypothetical protein ACGO1T_001037 [Streptococcus suis]